MFLRRGVFLQSEGSGEDNEDLLECVHSVGILSCSVVSQFALLLERGISLDRHSKNVVRSKAKLRNSRMAP